MSRRFSLSSRSVLLDGPSVHSPPGFIAFPVAPVPAATQQLWHTIYQLAYTQALGEALAVHQPSKYQRIFWNICFN